MTLFSISSVTTTIITAGVTTVPTTAVTINKCIALPVHRCSRRSIASLRSLLNLRQQQQQQQQVIRLRHYHQQQQKLIVRYNSNISSSRISCNQRSYNISNSSRSRRKRTINTTSTSTISAQGQAGHAAARGQQQAASSSSSSSSSSSVSEVFATKAAAVGAEGGASGAAAAALEGEPSRKVLRRVAFTTGLPFVGFGFMDNAILIIAGDAIDTSLGVTFGISTLCAAAIGNIISDLAGIGAGAYIEDFCATVLKLPVPKLSSHQRQLRSVRISSFFGMAVGMTIGCIIGMLPLLFIDPHKADTLRQKAKLEKLCMDVVNEAKTLVDAESTCLYLRVDENNNDDDNTNNKSSNQKNENSSINNIQIDDNYHPSVNGKYLYAMYYVEPAPPNNNNANNKSSPATTAITTDTDTDTQTTTVSGSRIIPVGKGIVSRAVLTGTTWNIAGGLNNEPDFFPLSIETAHETTADHQNGQQQQQQQQQQRFRDLVVVPILDAKGTPIAVLEAMNKKDGGTSNDGFSDDDIEILMSLASHVSVSLETIYRLSNAAAEDEDIRLKDTISILKRGKTIIQRSKTISTHHRDDDDDDDVLNRDRNHDSNDIRDGTGGTSYKVKRQPSHKFNERRQLFPD